MDWNNSVHTHYKMLDNESLNTDNHLQLGHVSVDFEKSPVRNLLVYRHLLHRDFHS